MVGSTFLFGGYACADEGNSKKTFYSLRGRNIERNGFKTVGEITYESCFTGGIVKGKCPCSDLSVRIWKCQ